MLAQNFVKQVSMHEHCVRNLVSLKKRSEIKQIKRKTKRFDVMAQIP
ncbi:hypothetical protein VISI1226_01365 [Vibrio sinaloensis DSM 21326]|uniref:Uncharacterized protein n=1 Tax=Vibrio sinaloensis DSM 21326 TaxID=945550 RepID=E8M5D9_PHOS4|nr:hypothetical protein VISI1226_01365 [Vibrio sinaloensis DSM 21326]